MCVFEWLLCVLLSKSNYQSKIEGNNTVLRQGLILRSRFLMTELHTVYVGGQFLYNLFIPICFIQHVPLHIYILSATYLGLGQGQWHTV